MTIESLQSVLSIVLIRDLLNCHKTAIKWKIRKY